ncbi:Ribosomal large subunit pseudouridine synthase C [Marinobacterium lacunae]|uniref:Pseudouridine synthase n=1 Tax=Marinobacterium lacunae TaxID=1232683 RepID=A0A081FTY3_9GAMM|nr:23S rRNA pseudouridine(955/2504/2580) synthase RluC [Marinobacterium lacunae]KEA61988.1 Ribosomal large subunit pseudouridine synthase C [Marinobacterium lacunae]MBR9882820.1 23S rRNA pseudouridine(955/2504/2580) synthase RluC [Oceanospirillales bacterium]
MADESTGIQKGVQFITVEEDQGGQRIDNFLRTALKGAPKSLIYRVLRKGEVRVNKKRIKPEYKLQAGDLIRVPPVRLPEKGDAPVVGDKLLEHLESAVVYEDDALMVINKPSGLAVHGGSGVNLGLIEAVRQLRSNQRFLELVHRLDRDTSGCIMIAKKRSMLRYLHELLRQHKVQKIYHALVQGRWESKDKRVDAPLLRGELKSGERFVRVDAEGKPSQTDFRILRRYGTSATLIEARPRTGRTHQIRVHTQFVGHPIIGDPKYGVDAINQQYRELGFRRLMLHAAALELKLPDGTPLKVEAALDAQVAQALEKLVTSAEAQEQR